MGMDSCGFEVFDDILDKCMVESKEVSVCVQVCTRCLVDIVSA